MGGAKWAAMLIKLGLFAGAGCLDAAILHDFRQNNIWDNSVDSVIVKRNASYFAGRYICNFV